MAGLIFIILLILIIAVVQINKHTQWYPFFLGAFSLRDWGFCFLVSVETDNVALVLHFLCIAMNIGFRRPEKYQDQRPASAVPEQFNPYAWPSLPHDASCECQLCTGYEKLETNEGLETVLFNCQCAICKELRRIDRESWLNDRNPPRRQIEFMDEYQKGARKYEPDVPWKDYVSTEKWQCTCDSCKERRANEQRSTNNDQR